MDLIHRRLHFRASSSDPYWQYVVALIGNNNAANGTTTFIDQSSNGLELTRNGSTIYSDSYAPTGMTTSIYSGGSGNNYLSTPNNSILVLGTSDYCVEAWIRYVSKNTGTYPAPMIQILDSTHYSEPVILPAGNDANLYVSAKGGTSWYVNQAWSPSVSTWYHVAVSSAGNTVRFFVNGTAFSPTKDLTGKSLVDQSAAFRFCAFDPFANLSNVYWGPIRVTKGVPRYTGNFTPPTLPLPTATT